FPGTPSLYSTANGTSASTPIVAGIAGLLLSHFTELNPNQVRDAIRLTASQSNKPDTVYGWGITDAVEVISFPQIVKRSEGYFLLKSFFDSDINPSTVKFHYSEDGGKSYSQFPMNFVGSEVKFDVKLQGLSEDDKIRFYFTYQTKLGIERRLPAVNTESYSFVLKDKKVFPPSEPLNLVYDYKLYQSFPNPFNNTTRIKFDLPISQNITINVFDILGRKIRTLVNNIVYSAGNHFIDWNGKNDFDATIPSGVYFYRLETERFNETKKLVLLK
ncbi:MAG: T9SS type A sorting domain-containing protein, partial [Bacteroidetes bacterium]|nr:T9SS type A sorting domain-containing protein [Bacteroidota bacterium]